MKHIQQLQQIDASQIENEALKQMLIEYLNEYKAAEDPEDFVKVTTESADKILTLVKTHFPNAVQKQIPKHKQQKTNSKTQATTGKSQKSKIKEQAPKDKQQIAKAQKQEVKKNQQSKKVLNGLQKEIEQCRSKIRKYNEDRRKDQPKKPKPTRYDKIKSHLIAIGNLIPEKLEDDLRVQQETRRILLRTHRQIMDNYQMSTLKARKDHDAMKERFESKEEKLKQQ